MLWRISPTLRFHGLKEDSSPLHARQDALPRFSFPSAPWGNISSRQPPDRVKISKHDSWCATIERCEALCKTTPLLRAITFQQVININTITAPSSTMRPRLGGCLHTEPVTHLLARSHKVAGLWHRGMLGKLKSALSGHDQKDIFMHELCRCYLKKKQKKNKRSNFNIPMKDKCLGTFKVYLNT